MLSWMRRKNSSELSSTAKEMAILLEDLRQHLDLRINELSAQIKDVELSVQQLEVKLLTKDLKDKQQYGLLHYKLHEKKSEKLEDELRKAEEAFTSKKRPVSDH